MAGEALGEARALDALVDEFDETLRVGRETARLSPRRRASLAELERYGASFAQVDFAVRDTRVLARHAVRLRALRRGDRPGAAGRGARARARRLVAGGRLRPAGARRRRARPRPARGRAGAARRAAARSSAQIRSTAVDLRRAADLLGAEPLEAPTEELLAAVV